MGMLTDAIRNGCNDDLDAPIKPALLDGFLVLRGALAMIKTV